MSLRESLKRTPDLLAALRRNARKCADPKTSRGKAHFSLNPAGRDGRVAHRLPQKHSAVGAGWRELRRKKDVKNEVRSHHVVENKHKCLWNEAIF